MCDKYSGWANRPTWAVKLWMDNDYGLYHHTLDMAREHSDDRYDLAAALKDLVEEHPLTAQANMHSDLLSWSIGMVDFYEIADALIEAVKEEDYDDDEDSTDD